MNSISDIKHALYINLKSRTDRKQHAESQLKTIGVTAARFDAVKLTNGALGCSMSHLKCLELAKKNNWEHVLIVEDDITFLNPELFKIQFTAFLSKHKEYDVILIAGNNMPPYESIDQTCVKVSTCQTTTGYLVMSHYYDTLIENYRNGILKLINSPENHQFYAIDKYWFELQRKDKWYLIIPLTVTQQEGYSDIEKRPTNYTKVMTDLDKTWLIQPSQINTNDIPNIKMSAGVNVTNTKLKMNIL